jgi:hypothetical protein
MMIEKSENSVRELDDAIDQTQILSDPRLRPEFVHLTLNDINNEINKILQILRSKSNRYNDSKENIIHEGKYDFRNDEDLLSFFIELKEQNEEYKAFRHEEYLKFRVDINQFW